MADFAPLYTTRERLWLLVKTLAVALPVYLAGYHWLFPWLRHYAQTANCDRFGAFNGLELLLYGLFVGMPLSMAALIWMIEGRRSLRVWRLGQSPLPGEKVLRKTRYKFGSAARMRPLAVFALLALLLAIALRGGFTAAGLVRVIGPCDSPNLGQASMDAVAESRARRHASC